MAFLHSVVAALVLAASSPGWLGILLAEADRPTIAEVIPDSPAARAGLEPGDIVTAVDDAQIHNVSSLVRELGRRSVGTEVRLRVSRGGASREIAVTLGVRPENADPAPPPSGPLEEGQERPAPAGETRAGLVGFSADFEAGLAAARASGRGVLLLCGSPGSPPSRALAETLDRPDLAGPMQRYTRVWIDPRVAEGRVAELEVTGIPSLVILDSDGVELATLTEVGHPEVLRAFLEQCPSSVGADRALQDLAAEVRALRRQIDELKILVRELASRRR